MKNNFNALIIITLLFSLISCTSDSSKETKNDLPSVNLARADFLSETDNIVLIVFDTLRADRLPFYGSKIDTAPFLNSLAENAVVFDRAIAACSSTAPSMSSLFTSVYPSQHGVVVGKMVTRRLKKANPTISLNKIPSSLTTLGELLRDAGYPGYGASDNLNISEEMGFLPGFKEFKTFHYEGAPKVNETIVGYKDILPNKHFMYVHYMDPHAPYNKRDPWFDSSRPDKDLAAYDSEIRYADEHLKKLFDLYKWHENSLIIFLSDHGEEFGEHGNMGHGKNLYPESIRVPLFFYHRNLKAGRIADTAHLIDILPTIAEILGVKSEKVWEGRSLLPYLLDSSIAEEKQRFVYSELLRHKLHSKNSQRAVVEDSWLFKQRYNDKNEKASTELFDMNFDPYAQKDLSETESDTLKHMSSGIDLLDAKIKGITSEELELHMDKDTVEHLKTLGYIN